MMKPYPHLLLSSGHSMYVMLGCLACALVHLAKTRQLHLLWYWLGTLIGILIGLAICILDKD